MKVIKPGMILIIPTLLMASAAFPNGSPFKEISAHVGGNVTMACGCPSSTMAWRWSIDGLGGKYVCFHRDSRDDPDNQHLSYAGRAECGDVTLYLKNVRLSDKGQYQCQCFNGQGEVVGRCSINLSFPGTSTGHNMEGNSGHSTTGNTVVISVFATVVILWVIN